MDLNAPVYLCSFKGVQYQCSICKVSESPGGKQVAGGSFWKQHGPGFLLMPCNVVYCFGNASHIYGELIIACLLCLTFWLPGAFLHLHIKISNQIRASVLELVGGNVGCNLCSVCI